MAQTAKSPPAMQDTWVRSLGGEDPLGKGTITHSSILVWRIHMDREAWQATIHEVKKSQTQLSDKAEHSTCVCITNSLCYTAETNTTL